MSYQRLLLVITTLVLFLIASFAIGDVPTTMNYQGRITDDQGQPVTDLIDITFTLYGSETGSDTLWSETVYGVNPNANGLISTILGQINPITNEAFAGEECWLGIQLDGSMDEITPRTQITSAGYSFRVETIDEAIAGTITGQLNVVGSEGGPGDDAAINLKNSVGTNSISMTVASDEPAFLVSGSGGEEVSINADEVVISQPTKANIPDIRIRADRIMMTDNAGSDTNFVLTSNGNMIGRGQILWGEGNTAGWLEGKAETWSTVFGFNNSANGDSSTVSGGYDNVANGRLSTIGGGVSNTVDSLGGTISGGINNYLSGRGAVIAGGEIDTAIGRGTFIGGGNGNTADGYYASIVSGLSNTAVGDYSSVTGGYNNAALGDRSFIAGGSNNFIDTSGYHSSIYGGEACSLSGWWSTLAGGKGNVITGRRSFIHGLYCRAEGDGSYAFGQYAHSKHNGSYVFKDNTNDTVETTADNQFLIQADGGVGINTNNPTYPLTVDGMIYSMADGFRFPDGSVQTSAAASITDGWTDGGSYIYPTNINDSVGIGTATPESKLHVNGDFKTSGSITIGNSTKSPSKARFADPGLEVFNSAGNQILDINVGTSNMSSFYDENGTSMIGINGNAYGPPNTVFRNVDNGNPVMDVKAADGTGHPIGVDFFDDAGTAMIQIDGSAYGPPNTVFRNVDNGNPVMDVKAADGTGHPVGVDFFNVDGVKQVEFNSNTSNAVFYNVNDASNNMTINGNSLQLVNSAFDTTWIYSNRIALKGTDDSLVIAPVPNTVFHAYSGSNTTLALKSTGSGGEMIIYGDADHTTSLSPSSIELTSGNLQVFSSDTSMMKANEKAGRDINHIIEAIYDGPSVNSDVRAFYGEAVTNPGWGIGGEFVGGYIGAYGKATPSAETEYNLFGVRGWGEGNYYADHVYGVSGVGVNSDGYNVGVIGEGYANVSGAVGLGVTGYVEGPQDATLHAIQGEVPDSTKRWAGYFYGNVNVTDTMVASRIEATTKAFKIDHPLDPENKYLMHSSVESPDMMDIYNGNVITDTKGYATVELPDYFEALNKDFRYQLTVIGEFAQAIVSDKIKENHFTIRTDKPNVEVSWQVTGIRNDASAIANRIPVEVNKNDSERGKYLDPQAFGYGVDKGVTYNERIDHTKEAFEKEIR